MTKPAPVIPDDQEAAAQLLRNAGWIITPPSDIKYGCFCDLFAMDPGTEPDGCVIDADRHNDCTYAKPGMKKESCEYWRPWTAGTLADYWKAITDAG